MLGILVVISISLLELGLVRFPREFVMLLLELLLLVLYLWVFRFSWDWFVVSICLLASMLLKHLMSLPRQLVLLGLLLCGQCGPLRCLLPALLLFLIFLMVL